MKREVKSYLKSLEIAGFKWDKNPIDMYKECEELNESETIVLTKRDLKKLIRIQMFRQYQFKEIMKKVDNF